MTHNSQLKRQSVILKLLQGEDTQIPKIELIYDDCLNFLKTIDDNSIGSIVCDPPYGININNKSWDKNLPHPKVWKECIRVLKPGGYILAFSSARNYHKLATSIENVGFNTHQMIGWIYSSGLPKGANLSKQIDRNVIPKPDNKFREFLKRAIYKSSYSIRELNDFCGTKRMVQHYISDLQPQYPNQKNWRILKNILNLDDRFDEKIKLISDLRLNRRNKKVISIENEFLSGFRNHSSQINNKSELAKKWEGYRYGAQTLRPSIEPIYMGQKPVKNNMVENIKRFNVGAIDIQSLRFNNINKEEKFPANVFLSSDYSNEKYSKYFDQVEVPQFIYHSKSTKKERGEYNIHPTVKPIKLMEKLVNLVTPPGEICLDPFMGSGTTGIACKNINRAFIGIEKDLDYYQIANFRIFNN